jgi:T4 RnlA family RNA ligase
MNWNLLTYEECKQIVDHNGEVLFYESILEVDGYKVSIFNYRMAQIEHFRKPLPGLDKSALEMRGITFIFNEDGTLYNRYIMLTKFFNINQVEETLHSNVKDLSVKSVMNKEDGSLISFVRLPNGKVLARTKMSFESEQAIASTRLYNTRDDIKKLVDSTLDNNEVLFFEYVNYNNRVVLEYKSEDLILLRSRNNMCGSYNDISKYDTTVTKCNFEKESLDDIIDKATYVTDKEGWVVEFSNNTFIKVKTKWYFDLHHLTFGVVNRENDIIRVVMDDKVDDLLSNLDATHVEQISFIKEIENICEKKLAELVYNVKKLVYLFTNEYNSSKKDFAINNRKDDLFGLAMAVINGEDIYDVCKSKIKKITYRLESARNWLNG